jgi:hypothetical protein
MCEAQKEFSKYQQTILFHISMRFHSIDATMTFELSIVPEKPYARMRYTPHASHCASAAVVNSIVQLTPLQCHFQTTSMPRFYTS